MDYRLWVDMSPGPDDRPLLVGSYDTHLGNTDGEFSPPPPGNVDVTAIIATDVVILKYRRQARSLHPHAYITRVCYALYI